VLVVKYNGEADMPQFILVSQKPDPMSALLNLAHCSGGLVWDLGILVHPMFLEESKFESIVFKVLSNVTVA
jgi:hypothetical protein